MRRFKCLSVDTTNMRHFTIGKIYETDDNMLNYRLDGGHVADYCPLIEDGDVERGLIFEEVKEEGENKMESAKGNLKVKCLDVRGYDEYYTKGKVYEVVDGVFTYDNGYVIENITSFEDFNIRTAAMWELIEDSSDLRELIKPCYVVRFRGGTSGWCIAMNRSNGRIGFNSIDNLQRGIVRMSSLDEKLLDNSNMSEYDIMEIRGYADVDQTRIDNRPLIWKRTELSPTQLKLEELEKKQREIADEMEKLRKEL